jgi:recombination associated protein RdgC
MFFRNLTLFRFPETVEKSLASLEQHLDEARARPCGPLELNTRGFVSPFGRQSEELVHRVAQFALFTVGGEDKLLPSSVVNEALSTRLQKITDEEGRRVGARERKRLKDEVLTDLLPRAFAKPYRMSAYVDSKSGWVAIDTASRKAAEECLSQLRESIGTFPAVPMAPEESPRTLMTDWVVHGKLPSGLVLGDECELRDPAESGAIVRCRRQDLETDEVREHLKSGKQVFQLSLTFDDRIGFVLGEDLALRKVRLLDHVVEELGDSGRDSANAEVDSRFALMTLEFERLLVKLEEWFGLPRPTAA